MLPRYLQNILVDENLLFKRLKFANQVGVNESLSILPGFDPAQLLLRDLQVCVRFGVPICVFIHFLKAGLLRDLEDFLRPFWRKQVWRGMGSHAEDISHFQSARRVFKYASAKGRGDCYVDPGLTLHTGKRQEQRQKFSRPQ